ncbi:serine/threonine-protein kinase [soil metagenome]
MSGELLSGRYRLDRILGEGGMGVVWPGTATSNGSPVAIKCLKTSSGMTRAEHGRRLAREARAIRAIDHPNVARVLAVATAADGSPAIVMELLEGETLRKRLDREGRLDLASAAKIVMPVISALGRAHSLGIVHRDLKPDNVFIGNDGVVRILDFGIAKLTAAEGIVAGTGGLTGTGAILGTPYYMSPEQVFSEASIDARADVWALGVVLYECFAGRRPIEGANAGQVLRAITAEKITPLAQLAPDLPEAITDLVSRMLSFERADRPSDLNEAYDVFRPYSDTAAPTFGPATNEPPKLVSPTQRLKYIVPTALAIALSIAAVWLATHPHDR